MKRLLTFEAFIPKNIEKRFKDLEKNNALILAKEEKIKALKLAEFQKLVKDFTDKFEILKTANSENFDEQFFLDFLKDCHIFVHTRTNRIYIDNVNNEHLFEYEYVRGLHHFWMHGKRVAKFLSENLNIPVSKLGNLIQPIFEKYFNISKAWLESSSLI